MPAGALQQDRVLPEFIAELRVFRGAHGGTVQNYRGRLQSKFDGKHRSAFVASARSSIAARFTEHPFVAFRVALAAISGGLPVSTRVNALNNNDAKLIEPGERH